MATQPSNRKTHSLDDRRSRRAKLLSVGQLLLPEGPVDCQMIEVSLHGAKAAVQCDVSCGDFGLLRCEGLDILFRVIRIAQHWIAIEFVDESDDGDANSNPERFSRVVRNYQILRLLSIRA